MEKHPDLTKVLIDLPNHWAKKGESMWALELGGDSYELRNSPFYAYDLNYLDVVYAVADNPDHKPQIKRVQRRSGHKTLRVIFKNETTKPQRDLLLKGLNRFGVTWEGHEYRLFSLDIPPHGDYRGTCTQLMEWETNSLLEYETCEARVVGSFDDEPSA
jgi:hypothetical protein